MAVVLLTGGSSGIGLATARRLAAAGDQGFCDSRHPFRTALPAGVTPLPLDVADPAAAPSAVRAVLTAACRLDVLVINAGTVSLGPLEEAADAEAERVCQVNLFGPMRLARASAVLDAEVHEYGQRASSSAPTPGSAARRVRPPSTR